MLKPRRLPALLIVMLCGQVAQAERLRVTDVAMGAGGNVQFDISWNDSWRASWEESDTRYASWDAAWVFVKYREKDAANWSHASLSSKDADHSAPSGAEMDVGLTGTRGLGVFLYRAADGSGEWACKGVKLRWLHADDEVADPTKVELSVHALEMVYVPQGAFYVGTNGQPGGSFTDGAWEKGDAIIPFKISSEAELKIAPEPGCLYGDGGIGAAHQIGSPGKLTAEFPKGYGAIYCMKFGANWITQ